jgi:hypothetical protein
MILKIKKIKTLQGEMKQLTFQHTFTDEYLSDMKAMGLTELMLDTLADEFRELARKMLIDNAAQQGQAVSKKRLVSKMDDGQKLDMITSEPNHQIDYDRWNFNHQVGDIVKFADGAFENYNKLWCYNALKPELKNKNGVVTKCYCEIHAFSRGSIWVCSVDFDGEIVEAVCGYFEKI